MTDSSLGTFSALRKDSDEVLTLRIEPYDIDSTEFLCIPCSNVARKTEKTKGHTYSSNAPVHHCEIHTESVIEYYCKTHDDVFCGLCLKLHHASCQKVKNISEVCKGYHDSQDYRTCLSNTKSLIKKLSDFKENKNKCTASIKQQSRKCLDDIKHLRAEANKMFDRLERQMEDRVSTTERQEMAAINGDLSDLDSALNSLQITQRKLIEANTRGRDEEVFICVKKATPSKMESLFQDRLQEDLMVDIGFEVTEDLRQLEETLQTMGQLNVDTYTVRMQRPCMPTVIPDDMKDKRIEMIRKISIKEPSDLNECRITGIALMPTGEFLLCDDHNHKLKMTNTRFTLKSSIKLNSDPYDVAVIKPTEAVITLCGARKLQFVTFKPALKLGGTVDLGRQCYGVEVYRESMLVGCRDEDGGDVLMLSVQGTLQRTIPVCDSECSAGCISHSLAVSDTTGCFYVSHIDENTITCHKIEDGMKVKTYTEGLSDPCGILVDTADNLYVCNFGKHNIQTVLKNGNFYKTLLPLPEEIRYPCSLCHRERDRTLILGCASDNIIAYIFK